MTDAEILDQAITNIEGLHKNLWSFRAMVKELGDIKTQYKQTKESLKNTEKYRDDLNSQVEAAKADLANIAKQRQETVREIAMAEKELASKRQEAKAVGDATAQIKAMLRAA
jgi:septal ring factor EnvC (AmiA/AmiB activator)